MGAHEPMAPPTRRQARPGPRTASTPADAARPGHHLLGLQGQVGNDAVARLVAVQRQPVATTAAPATVAHPAAALAGTIEKEHAAAVAEYRTTANALQKLEAVETPTEEQTAEKATLTTRLGLVEKTILKAESDLRLLHEPGASAQALNELLARRGTAATVGKTTDTARVTALTDKGYSATTSTPSSSVTAGTATTTTETSGYTLTPTSVSWTSGNSTSTVTGNSGATNSSSTTGTVGAADGNLGYSSATTTKATQTNTDPTAPFSASSTTVEGKKIGTGGYTTSRSNTEQVDSEAFTNTRSSGVARGDGKIGYTSSSGRSAGTVDETGALVKGTSTNTTVGGGAVAGPDGYGGYATAAGDASRTLAKDVKVGVSGGLDGKFTVNVTQTGFAPPAYSIVVTLTLGAKLGASFSGESAAEKSGVMKSRGVGGSVSPAVTASGAVTATFTHAMNEPDAKAYLDTLEGTAGGAPTGAHRELAILAAAYRDGDSAAIAMLRGAASATGDPVAAAALPEGDSMTTKVEGRAGATGTVGAKVGGGPVGLSGGSFVTGSVAYSVTKKDGLVVVTATPSSGSGWTVGGTGGYGVATAGMTHESTEEVVRAFTFTLDPNSPDYEQRYRQIADTGDPAALDRLAVAHPELKPVRAKTTMNASTDTTTAGVGPLSLGITGGSSRSSATSVDAKGKTTVTEAGGGSGGANLSVAGIPMASYTETAKVSTTVTPDNVASGDVNVTTSESDLGATAEQFVKAPLGSAVGLVTGATKIAQKTDSTGMALSDEDYQAIESAAEGDRWNRVLRSPRDVADWGRCRARVRAANGDRAAIARALADFVEGDSSRRAVMVEHTVRPPGTARGGARYEWPGELAAQKGVYDALVVGDPLAPILALRHEGKEAGAKGLAGATIGRLTKLAADLRAHQAAFADGTAHGEMLRRIADRQAEVTREVKLMEKALPASDATTVPTPEQVAATHDVDRDAARTRFVALRQSLDAFLATQGRLFGAVQAEQAKKDAWFDKPDPIVIANKLNELRDSVYPQWESTLAQARTAGATAGEAVDTLPAPARGWWQHLYDATFKGW